MSAATSPLAMASRVPAQQVAASASTSSNKMVDWLKDNWQVVAAVSATGTLLAGVYLFVSPSRRPSPPRAKTSKTPTKSTADSASATGSAPNAAASSKTKKTAVSEKESLDLLNKDPASVKSDEERAALALRVKEIGNRYFKEKNFDQALLHYSKAIDFKKDCVFYANRAACYVSQGKNEEAIADCTKSLELDRTYTKAITRRALAYEVLEQYENALNDYTAAATLQVYRQETTIASCERVLGLITAEKVKAALTNRKFRLPSKAFISAYMDAFSETSRGISKILNEGTEEEGDVMVQSAYQAIKEQNWKVASERAMAAKSAKLSKKWEDLAYNLSATFNFILGDIPLALEDINKALDLNPNRVSSIIKKAAINLELGNFQESLAEYSRAIIVGPKDADAHYHYAQMLMLKDDVENAITEYKKACDLDDSFLFAHIQLAVSHYKNRDVTSASQVFEKTLKKFKDNAIAHNYFGEVCLDLQEFDKALENIDKAIELDPNGSLAYVNKAMCYLHTPRDLELAKKYFKKAIEVDPLSDVAWTQLGQLEAHSMNFDEALKCYSHSLELARAEVDIKNVITITELAKVQAYVHKTYPEAIKEIQNIVASTLDAGLGKNIA